MKCTYHPGVFIGACPQCLAACTPTPPATPNPNWEPDTRNPYEPDRSMRCDNILRKGDAFNACNRTRGHEGDHMRSSYSGVTITTWAPHHGAAEACGPCLRGEACDCHTDARKGVLTNGDE